ncbi:MAG TPA: hypothetical protein VF221_06560 [Chloroflexota bacterium]
MASLVAAVLSLPSVLLAGILGSVSGSWSVFIGALILLVGIMPNPAVAGLQYVAHGIARSTPLIGIAELADGYRAYAPLAFKAWLVGIAGAAIILGNLAFYATQHAPLFGVLRLIWLYLLYVWLGAHLYVYPLIVEQHVKRVLLIYRNAIVMSVTRPVFTLVAGLVWLVVVVVTCVTGLAAVFGLGLAAVIQQNAGARLLATFDKPATAD